MQDSSETLVGHFSTISGLTFSESPPAPPLHLIIIVLNNVSIFQLYVIKSRIFKGGGLKK